MKNKKSLLLKILGVVLITSVIMYRKYKRAALREQQLEIKREEAKKYIEFKNKQDSIKRRKEYDSIQAIKLKEANDRIHTLKEKREQLQETMKKLEAETKK